MQKCFRWRRYLTCGTCFSICMFTSTALITSFIRLVLVVIVTIGSFKDNPMPKNDSLLDSKLANMGNLLYQLAIMFQHIALIYGICKFCVTIQFLWKTDPTATFQSTSAQDKTCHYSAWENYTAIIGISLLYIIALVAAPTVLMIWLHDFVLWFNDDVEEIPARIYAGMAWIQHLTNVLIRVAMAVVTTMVVLKWSSQQAEVKKCTKFSCLIINYQDTGKIVAALNSIFQGWFIVQWIIFFIGVSGKGTLVLKSILHEEYRYELHRFAYILTHVIFDILAFMIPYFFGVLMNQYHQTYYQQLREKQKDILSNNEDFKVKILMCANLVPKNPSFEFIPSLFRVSIPLDNAGYILTIVLAILTFIATFLVTFADITKL